MVINFFGEQYFKIQFGDFVLAYNPISKEADSKGSKFGSDIALVSFDHSDFNGIDEVVYGDREPFVITGPGEYEIQEVFIRGFHVRSKYKDKEGINTIYHVVLEDMNLVFLGAISDGELPGELVESVDEVDMLFVPVDGGGLLSPSDAYKVAVKLEAKLVIPMSFKDKKDENLKKFLKEGGAINKKSLDKLTVKRKDLSGREVDVTVLEPEQ